jgi:Predicted transcriptional regulators
MILTLDFSGETPIYLQIRNQIVMGIAGGQLRSGEKLPTIRTLGDQFGINMMTVNKAYQLLKQEGYIVTDRRIGAVVQEPMSDGLPAAAQEQLRLLVSEAKLHHVSKAELLALCGDIYDSLEGDNKL